MNETVLRQWAMLRMIPRAPRYIETVRIERGLRDQGYRVTRRTIQRDLQALSSIFPLTCADSIRPYSWSWSEDAAALDVPSMEPSTAVAFCLAEAHLRPLLPRTVLRQLDPQFRRARELLAGGSGTALALWPDRVRVIQRGPELISPPVLPEIQAAVYRALLEARRIEIVYRARSASKPRTYEVHPLALVVRQGLLYLVCTTWDYRDVRHFVLHRMSQARVLDEPAHLPTDFDLDGYLRGGAFGYPRRPDPIRLRLLVDAPLAVHLTETPLSAEQRMIAQEDGRSIVEARVLETAELHWWLLGLGAAVEVLAPAALRREIRDEVERVRRRYLRRRRG